MNTLTKPANEHCFLQPHWRVIAQGFQPDHWFDDNQAVGTGGILNPRIVHLHTGNYYYRFASSSAPVEAQLGGGWWLDFENFKKIESFAQSHDYSIRDAARLMLALPHAWTRVDIMIKALLALPMKAFAGEGKPAQGATEGADKGTKWIPTQHSKLCQLYVPGLYVKGVHSSEQLYRKVFVSPVYETLS